jgi:hypothetical protein
MGGEGAGMKGMKLGGGGTPNQGKMAAMMGMGSKGKGMGDGPSMLGGQGGRPDGITLSKPDAKTKARLTRTEFVILFIWREPTPSDQLLPEETGAPTETPVNR